MGLPWSGSLPDRVKLVADTLCSLLFFKSGRKYRTHITKVPKTQEAKDEPNMNHLSKKHSLSEGYFTKGACFFDISVVFSLFSLTFCEYLGCLGKYKHLNYNL